MNIIPQRAIIPHTIHLKSLYTYQSYLVKRPKHTKTFRFSRQTDLALDDQITLELLLQKSLRLLKYVKTIDLSKFQVKGERVNQNLFQACFKKQSVSKASSLLFTRHQQYEPLGSNSAEKSLKYLSRLRSLAYVITAQGLPKNPSCSKDPLRYIRYCPKVESLQIESFASRSGFSELFSRFQSYPTSLKHLVIGFPTEEGQDFVIHLEKFTKLESICLRLAGSYYDFAWTWNINGQGELPGLEDIPLVSNKEAIPKIYSLPTKVANRKTLKKLCLISPDMTLIEKDVLKALPSFDQLTHFNIHVFIEEDKGLELFSECLENMKHLQDLSLSVRKADDFLSTDPLMILCQKIQNLQALRHLHLSFSSQEEIKEMPNLIVHCNPSKLESLSLDYPQQNPTQSWLDLALILKDSLTTLRELRISFGSFSPDPKSYPSIIQFISSLSNIQVLEMKGLDIEDNNFFSLIVEAISSFKFLRELTFGEIGGQVTPSEYENALKVILSKRGLRRFECRTEESLSQSCGLLAHRYLYDEGDPCCIDMKVVERKNPFIEYIKLSDHIFARKLLRGIANWP